MNNERTSRLDRYLARERDCRERAEKCHEGDTKRDFEMIADQFKRLAELVADGSLG